MSNSLVSKWRGNHLHQGVPVKVALESTRAEMEEAVTVRSSPTNSEHIDPEILSTETGSNISQTGTTRVISSPADDNTAEANHSLMKYKKNKTSHITSIDMSGSSLRFQSKT